ncbi:acyltransferase family protein [Sporocytophaga myxococcoides]|uniref:acyltransferase family protein n=1 Tax=Sporocytophaga myxococcoides TaxID=153721 RepID=UPI00041A1B66
MSKVPEGEKEELFSIHFLKFLSLIGVVFIHYSFFFKEQRFHSEIFRFCVPIFILSSVFLFERANIHKELGLSFLSKRLLRLSIPFICWSVVYFLIFPHRQTAPLKILTTHFLGYGWSGQYYFFILFQVTIIYFFIRRVKLINGYYLLAIGVSTLIIYWILFYGIYRNALVLKISNRLFIYWTFYIIVAIWLARNYSNIRNHKYRRSVWLVALLMSFPLLISLEEHFYPITGRLEEYCKVSILIASTCLFGLVLMEESLVKIIISDHLKNLIRMVSKYSLGIFCLNPLVITMFQKVAIYYRIQNGNILISIPLIIIICVSISLVLEKLKLGVLIK